MSGAAFENIDVGKNINYYLGVSMYGSNYGISSVEIDQFGGSFVFIT